MNVCHFGFSLSLISGHSKPAFELADNLSKSGVNVKILSSELPGKYASLHQQLLEKTQLSVEEYRPFLSAFNFIASRKKRVIREILSWADIIHVYGPHSLFLLQKYFPRNSKVILSINSMFKLNLKDFLKSGLCGFKNLVNPSGLASMFPSKYFSLTFSKADAIICWTKFMQKQVKSLGMNNSFFIPVGVNTGNFCFKKNTVGKDFIFLYLGYLASARGVSDLVRAFELVQQQWSSTKLVIAHTGLHPTEQDAFLRQISNSTSRDSIEITGFSTVLSETINKANVVVLPFRTAVGYSQPPLTVLEALAHGRPVITTNVGCLSEIVHNGYSGFCIEPVDCLSLAGHMLKFRELDLNLMSRNATEYIVQNHSWSDICQSTVALYNQVLQE